MVAAEMEFGSLELLAEGLQWGLAHARGVSVV